MTQGSMVDRIYRSLLLSKYFTKGWGSPKDIKRLLEFRKYVCDRSECVKLVPDEYPVEIHKDYSRGKIRFLEGKFRTPFDLYLPELLPKEVKDCHFQMILPVKWREEEYKPVCIQMAATGDHFYWRRRYFMAKPLLKEAGIASILLQNPFYGDRKPAQQTRSVLNNVLDIFTMGGCLIMEAMILHSWCKKQGFGPIGFTGYSMGGHMASLAATNIPEPVVLVPCLSWSTASGVFTEGVMSKAIDWELLLSQYDKNESFKSDIKNMVRCISEDAFRAGKQFMRKYAEIDLKQGDVAKIMRALDEKAKANPKDETPFDVKQWHAEYKKLVTSNSSAIKQEKNVPSYEEKLALLKRLSIPQQKGASPNSSAIVPKKKPTIREGTKKLLFALLEMLSNIFSLDKARPVDWEQHEAFHFMKGIMDECTHLANFSEPVDTSLVIAVCAVNDEYVPRNGVSHLHDIWPLAEVRFVEGGHVLAFILHQKEFKKAVIDAFDRYKDKYIVEKK